MRTPAKRSSSRGSHATWSEGDSRTCLHCGQPLRITDPKARFWIHTENGVHTSSHAACGPPWEAHPSARCGKAPANPTRQEHPLTETPTEPAPDEPDEPDTDNGDETETEGDE